MATTGDFITIGIGEWFDRLAGAEAFPDADELPALARRKRMPRQTDLYPIRRRHA
ncbi:hypothetical protein [Rhizobium tibeticum]|uniref:hypothetical protein n=1 Tax=Rhizobium tibeticum TaxID=501024 RepID=UPI000A692384|nr:hypothetical protein [Rhizobium tibeticum]